ncbi:hypothetical protein HDU76_005639 [Blyttiomyces sp. JEL0837]|nr:hypothetical protein HDU76_005639 [Blyttiomyces sp. JEL0837]
MHFTVIVNPYSGLKTASDTATSLSESLLSSSSTSTSWIQLDPQTDLNDIIKNHESQQHTFTIIKTTKPNHANEIAFDVISKLVTLSTTEKKKFQIGFLTLGGDGLIHEVVNGVMNALIVQKDDDASKVGYLDKKFRPKVLIGVVPCGTGNALATTLGITSPTDAITKIITSTSSPSSLHKFTQPLHLQTLHIQPAPTTTIPTTTITTNVKISFKWPQSKPTHYTFCVISYGLHAQIVKQSDSFRLLGNKRFLLAAMMNVVLLKIYHGDLFVDVESSVEFECVAKRNGAREGEGDVVEKDVVLEDGGHFKRVFERGQESGEEVGKGEVLMRRWGDDGFTYFLSTKMSHLEPGFPIAPFATPTNRQTDLILANKSMTSQQVGNMLNLAAKGLGRHLLMEGVDNLKVRRFVLVPKSAASSSSWASWFGGSGSGADVCVDGEMVKVQEGDAVWVRDLEFEDDDGKDGEDEDEDEWGLFRVIV